MAPRRSFLLSLIALLVFCNGLAQAQEAKALKGIALVIGEAQYQHLPALANPANDARAIQKLLTDLGFEVTPVQDGDARKLVKALRRFAEDAEDADVALIYYSGHGIEAGGENYLIPIDADLTALDNADERLIPLAPIMDELTNKLGVTIVLLDACRTNPFPPGAVLKTSNGAVANPVSAQGLAAPKGATPIATGAKQNLAMVFGFAAEPGRAALDGAKGANSPYAAALLKHLAVRGFNFSDVMTMVTEEVYVATDGQQRPWTNASLRQFLYFGLAPEPEAGDEALIRRERRKLLLTIAATPDELKRTVETIAKEGSVPLAGMYDVLRALGTSNIPQDPAKLDRLLKEQAEALKKMVAERTALDSDDPEIKRLTSLADRAVDEGAMPAARRFLDEAKARIAATRSMIETIETRAKAKRAANAAVLAKSASLAALEFEHLIAAQDYAAAYDWVKGSNPALALTYKLGEAGARREHGLYKGDNTALTRSISDYGEALALAPRTANPADWAMIQNALGVALWTLGSRASSTELLTRAVAAYEAALLERTRQHAPREWAETLSNLGVALQDLGERENGTQTLLKAVAAYEASLTERTRERAPLDWARTEDNLGIVLSMIGQRETGTESLIKAAKALQAALSELSRERVPLEWAGIENNLGGVLQTLGERESGDESLIKAVAAYEAALTEATRERAPLQWAVTQDNLGNVLQTLGGRRSDPQLLIKAIAAYQAALTESTRERASLQWAQTENNLANALQRLAVLERGTDSLTKAVAAYDAALQELTRDRMPLQWAQTETNLGVALTELGKRENGTASLVKAVAAFEAALMEATRERVPLQWGAIQSNLGSALSNLGQRENETQMLAKAVVAFEAALTELTHERVPLRWADTQNNLGAALETLGQRETGTASLTRAVAAYEAALSERTPQRSAIEWAITENNLGGVLLTLGIRTKNKAQVFKARQIIQSAWAALKSAGYTRYDAYFSSRLIAVDTALKGFE